MNSIYCIRTLFLIISLLLAATVSSAPKLSDQLKQANNSRKPVRAKSSSELFQNALFASYSRLLQLVIIGIAGALVGLSSAQLYVHNKHKYDYLGDVYLSSLPKNVSMVDILPLKAVPSLRPPPSSSPASSLFLLPLLMFIVCLLAFLLHRRQTTTTKR